eukprot:scaffold471_cov372-Pavlova_lutheri.AAC.9
MHEQTLFTETILNDAMQVCLRCVMQLASLTVVVRPKAAAQGAFPFRVLRRIGVLCRQDTVDFLIDNHMADNSGVFDCPPQVFGGGIPLNIIAWRYRTPTAQKIFPDRIGWSPF